MEYLLHFEVFEHFALLVGSGQPLEPDFALNLSISWLQIEASMASMNGLIKIRRYDQLTNAAKEVCSFTKFLYGFDGLVRDACSISFLYFYQNVIQDQIRLLVDADEINLPKWSCVPIILKLASDFPNEYARFWPFEYDHIGTDSVLFTQEILSLFGQIGALLAHDIGLFAISFAKSNSPATGITAAAANIGMGRGMTMKKNLGSEQQEFLKMRQEMFKNLKLRL